MTLLPAADAATLNAPAVPAPAPLSLSADDTSSTSSLCSSGTDCSSDSFDSHPAHYEHADGGMLSYGAPPAAAGGGGGGGGMVSGPRAYVYGHNTRRHKKKRQQQRGEGAASRWQQKQLQLLESESGDEEVEGARQRVGGAVYGHHPQAEWQQQQRKHPARHPTGQQHQPLEELRAGMAVQDSPGAKAPGEFSSHSLNPSKPLLKPQLVMPLQASGFRYRPTRSPFKHKRIMMQQVGFKRGWLVAMGASACLYVLSEGHVCCWHAAAADITKRALFASHG